MLEGKVPLISLSDNFCNERFITCPGFVTQTSANYPAFDTFSQCLVPKQSVSKRLSSYWRFLLFLFFFWKVLFKKCLISCFSLCFKFVSTIYVWAILLYFHKEKIDFWALSFEGISQKKRFYYDWNNWNIFPKEWKSIYKVFIS